MLDFEGEEFAQVDGVSGAEEAVLGQQLWARAYWGATSGNVTDEVWKEYIKNQQPPEPDDEFHAVWLTGWPTDPAFSRNPKPPALAGGMFTGKLSVSALVKYLDFVANEMNF